MSKYQEMNQWDLEFEVIQSHFPQLSEDQVCSMVNSLSPAFDWVAIFPAMDGLMKITGGIFLKEDGSATAEINGKQETATGGHCRAICILYLMAMDAEVKNG